MPYRPQSANRLTERVHAVVRSAIVRAEVSAILVACSGGADSACLLHAVATVARQTNWRVTVCHVRHGVRPDDARDADLVRAMAACLGMECRVISLDLPHAVHGHAPSESAMRDARYRALAAVADEMHADAVLTGHTLDDQAETVLLHLLRGAGVDGLGGMGGDTSLLLPAVAPAPAISHNERFLRIVRPLLSTRRAETVAYCAAHGLVMASDPTNDDPRYTRNWLRHAVLPMLCGRNPDIAVLLARAASTIREDAAFLAAETASAMARCDCRFEASCVSIKRSAFASEHVAMQRRTLRDILQRITGATPRAADVDALCHHATTSRSSAIKQYGRVACALAFDRCLLGSEQAVVGWVRAAASLRYPLFQGMQRIHDDTRLRFALPDPPVAMYHWRLAPARHAGAERYRDDPDALPLRLPDGYTAIIRNRAPADRFWPHGSERPLPLRSYLSARGVPAPVRDRLPLLVVNDTIAWVIGHVVSAEFAASAATATHFGVLAREVGETNEEIRGKHG